MTTHKPTTNNNGNNKQNTFMIIIILKNQKELNELRNISIKMQFKSCYVCFKRMQ